MYDLGENVYKNLSFSNEMFIEIFASEKNRCTLQPHYNAPHYNAVFNITRPCHGSQVDYFAICL